MMTDSTSPKGQPFSLHQTIDAPREQVFKAWTDPEQISRWFVPVDGWSAPLSDIAVDARPGGSWKVSMVDETGIGYPAVFVYREIVEPGRLVFTTGQPDQDPNDPTIATATVTLTDVGGKTEMRYDGIAADPDQSEVGGWKAMFERMAKQLGG
jgi:uncharacterized protein YndB with AHSA1/START domain